MYFHNAPGNRYIPFTQVAIIKADRLFMDDIHPIGSESSGFFRTKTVSNVSQKESTWTSSVPWAPRFCWASKCLDTTSAFGSDVPVVPLPGLRMGPGLDPDTDHGPDRDCPLDPGLLGTETVCVRWSSFETAGTYCLRKLRLVKSEGRTIKHPEVDGKAL